MQSCGWLHFGERGFTAFDRGGLVLAPDRARHGFDVRNGARSPLRYRGGSRRFAGGIFAIALVSRARHLVEFVGALPGKRGVFVPSNLIGLFQRDEYVAQKNLRAVV